MTETFGQYARRLRETKRTESSDFTLRKVASRVGITAGYLSNLETDRFDPPDDEVINKLADDLGHDRDLFLAVAGRISTRLRNIIVKRPELMASLLYEIENKPDTCVLMVVRKVRDGNW